MKQAYTIKQVLSPKQTTILAPQLRQGVHFLQLSSMELQNEIDTALQSNPFLEKLEIDAEVEIIVGSREEHRKTQHEKEQKSNSEFRFSRQINAMPVSLRNTSDTQGTGSTAGQRLDSGSDTSIDRIMEAPAEQTLQGYLHQQVSGTPLDAAQRHILDILIDCVNDKGYLRASLDEVVELAMPDYIVKRSMVREVLGILQDFEPVGVGARNSSECLMLQLGDLPENTPGLNNAQRIVSHYLISLARQQFQKLAQELSITASQLQQAIALIRTLDPFPGLRISSTRTEAIVPDLIVKNQGDKWVVRLNPNVTPALSINQESADLLKLAKGQDGYQQLKQTLQEARELLSNIQKRYQTLLRVATLVVDHQTECMNQGEGALRPLAQKEIAQTLQIHVSTVSRAVNDKYIMTPYGVMELRRLFCSGIENEEGGAVSSKAIQMRIKALIEAEQKTSPLSDQALATLLEEQGIRIARRTVMKYRERLGEPASFQRRKTGF